MNKSIPIITISIGVIIAISVYLFAKTQMNQPIPTNEVAIISQDFTASHYNIMHVDTFISLVNKVYQQNVTQEKKGDQLIITIANQENIAKDFYNGNSALLSTFDLNDYGFEIKHDNQSTIAIFTIKDGGISVPNDVIIRLAAKYQQK